MKLKKTSQNFRLSPQMVRQLASAARKVGLTKTSYIELLLRKQFRKSANDILDAVDVDK
jgi:ribosomal protein S14